MADTAEISRFERTAKWRGFAAPLARLEIQPGARVLDLGCGSGVVSRMLVERFAAGQVVGLDLNPEYARAARELASDHNVSRVSFLAGNARQLPFADQTFDLVWAAFVVEYLAANVDDVLREFARIVRPGGSVAIFDVGGFLLHHEPIEPDLAARISRWHQVVLGRGFDPEIGWKLPTCFTSAGLHAVQAQSYPDPELYPEGYPGEEILDAWKQRLARMGGLTGVFGSEAEAERFRVDYLALLRQPNRRTLGANWLVWGQV